MCRIMASLPGWRRSNAAQPMKYQQAGFSGRDFPGNAAGWSLVASNDGRTHPSAAPRHYKRTDDPASARAVSAPAQ